MKRPRKSYPQGTQTKGSLTFEVRLRFRVRPAGYAGNDSCAFSQGFWALIKMLPIFSLVLRGDEEVKVTRIRWRRPGETWQQWDGGWIEDWKKRLGTDYEEEA